MQHQSGYFRCSYNGVLENLFPLLILASVPHIHPCQGFFVKFLNWKKVRKELFIEGVVFPHTVASIFYTTITKDA